MDPMEMTHIGIAICLGVALSAACGFRVFVPFFVASVCAKAGLMETSEGFAWLGSWPAMVAFGVATVVEVIAYYVPWLDNLLDTIATPAAVVAGTLASAAFIIEVDPLVQWSIAAIAGGGSAAVVQTGTVSLRAASTAVTGGAGNSVVSTAETGASLGMALLAVFVPVLAIALAVVLVVFLVRFAWRAWKSCCNWWKKDNPPKEELLSIK